MKTFLTFVRILCAIVFTFELAPVRVYAQDDSSRVRELEDRVRQLEAMVQTLIAAQQSAGQIPEDRANTMMAELSMTETAASNPPAAIAGFADPELGWTGKPLPQELLPNLGKIGATVSFTSGINSGPFSLNSGSYFAGSVDLPLALVPGGRLDYEIGIGLAQTGRNLPITSGVAQVANLTVLNALYPNGGAGNVQAALTGTGASPFVVTTSANWKAQVLQLTPFVLKYDVTSFDRYRIRPYVVLGMGTYVTVSNQDVAGNGVRTESTLSAANLALLSNLLGNSSAFGGTLIGGQVAPAVQLAQRRLPAGQGGVDLGVHFGGGVDWRISSLASVGLDARFNRVPGGLAYHTLAAQWGLHF